MITMAAIKAWGEMLFVKSVVLIIFGATIFTVFALPYIVVLWPILHR